MIVLWPPSEWKKYHFMYRDHKINVKHFCLCRGEFCMIFDISTADFDGATLSGKTVLFECVRLIRTIRISVSVCLCVHLRHSIIIIAFSYIGKQWDCYGCCCYYYASPLCVRLSRMLIRLLLWLSLFVCPYHISIGIASYDSVSHSKASLITTTIRKMKKKIRTNELNKRRGPYFYRSMLCCDQIDGSLCDVFYFIHTFLVFCFSSFEFNVRHPIAANYLVLHTSICTFNHQFLSFHLTKFSYTISWFLFTQ